MAIGTLYRNLMTTVTEEQHCFCSTTFLGAFGFFLDKEMAISEGKWISDYALYLYVLEERSLNGIFGHIMIGKT